MRVLHCPTETGGNAWGLSRAERELGIQSDVMVRRSSGQGFPTDMDLRLREGSLPARVLRLLRFMREERIFGFAETAENPGRGAQDRSRTQHRRERE